MNIAEWARLNGMSPEEFEHEIVLTMSGIADKHLDYQGEVMIYKCGFGEYAYEVIVRKL
jgi:hypothetical protein